MKSAMKWRISATATVSNMARSYNENMLACKSDNDYTKACLFFDLSLHCRRIILCLLEKSTDLFLLLSVNLDLVLSILSFNCCSSVFHTIEGRLTGSNLLSMGALNCIELFLMGVPSFTNDLPPVNDI